MIRRKSSEGTRRVASVRRIAQNLTAIPSFIRECRVLTQKTTVRIVHKARERFATCLIPATLPTPFVKEPASHVRPWTSRMSLCCPPLDKSLSCFSLRRSLRPLSETEKPLMQFLKIPLKAGSAIVVERRIRNRLSAAALYSASVNKALESTRGRDIYKIFRSGI